MQHHYDNQLHWEGSEKLLLQKVSRVHLNLYRAVKKGQCLNKNVTLLLVNLNAGFVIYIY